MRGLLRHRVGLYTPSETQDDIGVTVRAWSFERALWAGVEPLRVTETVENGRRVNRQTYRVTLRYRRDFPAQARLFWRGEQLRVLAWSDPDAKGERLHLVCESLGLGIPGGLDGELPS